MTASVETLQLKVNGAWRRIEVSLATRLLDVLREELGAWEVKEGCGTGHCGACTVLVGGRPHKACLTMVGQVGEREVVTVKGLADDPVALRLQEALVRRGAVQCGFCTPGMVVAATALLRSRGALSRREIRQGLVGNLCRCTGYQKIVDAVEEASQRP